MAKPKQYSEQFLQAFAKDIAERVRGAVMNCTGSGTSYHCSPSRYIEKEMPNFIAHAKKMARYVLGEGPPPWEKPGSKRGKM